MNQILFGLAFVVAGGMAYTFVAHPGDTGHAGYQLAAMDDTASSNAQKKRRTADRAIGKLRAIFKNSKTFRINGTQYDEATDTLTVSASFPVPVPNKYSQSDLDRQFKKANRMACKKFKNSEIYTSGMTLQLDVRDMNDAMVGTVTVSKQHCSA